MKPKEINGFLELTDSQIEKYIIFDSINGTIHFRYEYELNRYNKGTLLFRLKQSCDYIESGYIYFERDVYYYNDDLQIFFKSPELKKEKDHIKLIRRDLLKDNI